MAPLLRWRNVLVVFAVSGLWHGASWCFVIWGCLHGLYYLLGEWLAPLRTSLARMSGLARAPRVLHVLSVLTTFVLVGFAWIFFRAETPADALAVISGLGQGWDTGLDKETLKLAFRVAGSSRSEVRLGCLLILALLGVQALRGPLRSSAWLGHGRSARRWLAYTVLLLLVLNEGVVQRVPFLYFQF